MLSNVNINNLEKNTNFGCCSNGKINESSRKISISALLTMPKPLTVWITISCGKF